ncbi:unnamed protein product [Paramecium sonneborni]|uniref:Uncharacterized protein n=1 Tax=Paramecium sonneborni TaxID=65129 RepID=A0A8S1L7Z0_9CILI|nr:unnamed protein product [Paramecium sonneborni]
MKFYLMKEMKMLIKYLHSQKNVFSKERVAQSIQLEGRVELVVYLQHIL